jgi:D-alanyl-D-alanine dipeptidase
MGEKGMYEKDLNLTARQAVVVTTDDWEEIRATLRRYERLELDRPWVAVGRPVPVVVGRNGLAWGRGLHSGEMNGGPVKREGDGRAPAGIFRLSAAFGYAPAQEVPWIRMPYRQATPDLLCVDDEASLQYNRLVDRKTAPCDWKSAEEMRRSDGQYRLGVVVDHNTAPVLPGGGSCIFLHIWAGPDVGTSGCTAMAPEGMEDLLGWLDPLMRPVLIQMPQGVYEGYRKRWVLP